MTGTLIPCLNALAVDCENTDGWEAAAATCILAATEIASLRVKLERAKIFADEGYQVDSEIIDKLRAERDALQQTIQLAANRIAILQGHEIQLPEIRKALGNNHAG